MKLVHADDQNPTPRVVKTNAGSAAVSVEIVRTIGELEQLVPAWESLAQRAIEPNPFYEPWMLLPAMRRLPRTEPVETVVVWDNRPGAGGAQRELIGLLPLVRVASLKGLPITRFRSWQHLYCFLCTPLVDRFRAPECLDALLEWLARDGRAPCLLELAFAAADGLFHAAWLDALARHDRPMHALEVFPRALLKRDGDFQTYWSTVIRRRRRKEITRQANRLEEQGTIEFAELTNAGELEAWIRDFLSLEASGWKGRNGTALASRTADAAYFSEVASAAFARGCLQMLRMTLDGRPVAMKCNFRAGDGAWAFKIAYDEGLDAYSPGVQLEIENVRRVLANPGIAWMDSCAASDHFMANHLWPNRRLVQSSLIAGRGMLAELAVSIMPLLRWAARLVRRNRRSTGDRT